MHMYSLISFFFSTLRLSRIEIVHSHWSEPSPGSPHLHCEQSFLLDDRQKQRSVIGQDLSGLSLEECEALVPHGPGGWRKIREETQTNLAAILFIFGVERCRSLENVYMLETSEYAWRRMTLKNIQLKVTKTVYCRW
jgi:hypothetical protein